MTISAYPWERCYSFFPDAEKRCWAYRKNTQNHKNPAARAAQTCWFTNTIIVKLTWTWATSTNFHPCPQNISTHIPSVFAKIPTHGETHNVVFIMHVIRVVLDPTRNIAWHVNSETVTDTTAMQHPTKNALRKTSSTIVLKSSGAAWAFRENLGSKPASR